jgi:hypothetical protein
MRQTRRRTPATFAFITTPGLDTPAPRREKKVCAQKPHKRKLKDFLCRDL